MRVEVGPHQGMLSPWHDFHLERVLQLIVSDTYSSLCSIRDSGSKRHAKFMPCFMGAPFKVTL